MSTTLTLPKAIEDALLSLNPSTSRRSFLRSSGALVLSLGLNAVPGIVYGPGLLDAEKAEVHLVVRSHGPAVDGAFDAQLSTFGGGCDPIDVAPCVDVQYAMHLPVSN